MENLRNIWLENKYNEFKYNGNVVVKHKLHGYNNFIRLSLFKFMRYIKYIMI